MTTVQIGELIGVGRDADVFAIDDARVLRRYRDGWSAQGEVEVMAYLAAHGYPVPEVYPSEQYPDDLLMERLSGPTMVAALASGELAPTDGGRTLGNLLAQLHAIPAPSGSSDRILHLDLHPDNVILSPAGPKVIDWRNHRKGPPGLDWAMSGLILAQVAVNGLDGVDATDAAHDGLVAMLDEAGDGVVTEDHLRLAVTRRSADPNMSAYELDHIGDAATLLRSLLA